MAQCPPITTTPITTTPIATITTIPMLLSTTTIIITTTTIITTITTTVVVMVAVMAVAMGLQSWMRKRKGQDKDKDRGLEAAGRAEQVVEARMTMKVRVVLVTLLLFLTSHHNLLFLTSYQPLFVL
jgi:membrane protein insertase Oxa1/YidC/SpoIIIJ